MLCTHLENIESAQKLHRQAGRERERSCWKVAQVRTLTEWASVRIKAVLPSSGVKLCTVIRTQAGIDLLWNDR